MSRVHAAPIQLADLAAAMRPDWDRRHLEGAIAQATASGWPWPRVFAETARLLVQEDASPRDLTAAARSPLAPHGEPSPNYREWIAACREFLAIPRDGAA